MRRRLTLTTVAAAAIAVIVLGIPLAFILRELLVDAALRSLQSEARGTAALIQQQPSLAAVQLALTASAEATGTEAAVVGGRGQILLATPGFSPPTVEQLGADGAALAEGRLLVAVPTPLLGRSVVLYVDADAAPLQARVRQAWLLIGLVAATALLVAALAGSRQAREVARPLEDLAVTARRLGEGDFSARAAHSGLPEADMVADSLNSTADRLGVLVERARSFSADASHQLRTPLTALRLQLETLQMTGPQMTGPQATGPQTTGHGQATDHGAAAEALAELDRLDATITELLTLATPGGGGTVFVPQQLVDDRLDAWQTLAGAEGRSVHTDLADTPSVSARPAAVGQALQVLLDNAVVHGDGDITVSVAAAGRDSRWIRMCVADEGPGFDERRLPPPQPADRGTGGRGLALARSLVAAEGGTLRVERTPRGARVCLLLPAVPPDGPR